jgi:hypothetical protein
MGDASAKKIAGLSSSHFSFLPFAQTSLANVRKEKCPYWGHFFWLAERGGFEPPVPFAEYDGLANRWFKPTHPPLQISAFLSWEIFLNNNLSSF